MEEVNEWSAAMPSFLYIILEQDHLCEFLDVSADD